MSKSSSKDSTRFSMSVPENLPVNNTSDELKSEEISIASEIIRANTLKKSKSTACTGCIIFRLMISRRYSNSEIGLFSQGTPKIRLNMANNKMLYPVQTVQKLATHFSAL